MDEDQKSFTRRGGILIEILESTVEYLRGTNLTRENFNFERNNREAAFMAGEESGINKGHQSALEETSKSLL